MTSSDTEWHIIKYSKKKVYSIHVHRDQQIYRIQKYICIHVQCYFLEKGDQFNRNLMGPYIKEQTHIGKKNVRVREVIRDLFINGQLIIALLWMIQGIDDRPGTFLFTKSTMPNVLCMDRFSSFSFTKHKHCRASFRCDLSSVFGSRTSSSITQVFPIPVEYQVPYRTLIRQSLKIG